jgi:hypothetical protein
MPHDTGTWAIVFQAAALIFYAGVTTAQVWSHGKRLNTHSTRLESHGNKLQEHETILIQEGLKK